MPTDIYSPEVMTTIRQVQTAVRLSQTKTIQVDGQARTIPYPFPSPGDWRDGWIYFLLLDRFNNPNAPPRGPWNQKYDGRQGGTFNGVKERLGYIADLGAHAIWLSPVLKNARPDWAYNYHGYGAQDFLNVDERFASDGTRATAERELTELIEAAHARGLFVIIDIVLNHTARVFDYVYQGRVVDRFTDPDLLAAPPGQEPAIQWLNGFGFPRADWQNTIPDGTALSVDDAVWPSDLRRPEFFRRRGNKVTDQAAAGDFVRGDFDVMRQLVVEYDASDTSQQALRDRYGRSPVLNILILAYHYLIARYDIDGFRIDTVKYVAPDAVQTFGNAMREFALSIGKKNFFTFGEIYDDEDTIARFVGRNSAQVEGFGIDAALDFPLFFKLPRVAKAQAGVETIRQVFTDRKEAEQELLSSHGEAGRYFVTFLDNHDQLRRVYEPDSHPAQITLALAVMFGLQGIPCVYYGTEQGLTGTKDADGLPTLGNMESVREALWGQPQPFNQGSTLYQTVQALSRLRDDEPSLRYGRLYFREVSGNGVDFGFSEGVGGVVAFSRILVDREVVVIANTNPNQPFNGFVVVDLDDSRAYPDRSLQYSNLASTGTTTIQIFPQARFWEARRQRGSGKTAALPVTLAPMEVQIWTPVL